MSKALESLRLAYARGYRISTDGKIINPAGAQIFGKTHSSGYLYFNIDKNFPVAAHRLQALQKFGNDMFASGVEVRHKNGVRSDCSADNILLGTHTQNMLDIPSNVRRMSANKAAKARRKFSEEEIKNIRIARSAGKTLLELCKEFGICSKGHASQIVRGIVY